MNYGTQTTAFLVLLTLLAAMACNETSESEPRRNAAPPHSGIYAFANGCYTLDAAAPGTFTAQFLTATDNGESFSFSATEPAEAARFFLKASDLGTYLLYDHDQHYFVVEDTSFTRKAELLSDILLLDDTYLPGAQWQLELHPTDNTRFQLRHLKSSHVLTTTGLSDNPEDAAIITLYPAQNCAEFPELTLDAETPATAPDSKTFDDGSIWGIADTHSHILSNFGFGGGGIFHGAPFHPLGVEHALPSCEPFHGQEGRADLFGYGFDHDGQLDSDALVQTVLNKKTPEFNHHTAGYPDFTGWPNAPTSSTHQTQYYKWIERAYLAGLRLVVQHATSNEIICHLLVGGGMQSVRYDCNDMVAIDRQLAEARKLERYIDAQSGGPGKGWFRIVESPQQARSVINQGKMAVLLGIEVSNLFDCYLTPPEGKTRCTEQDVINALDRYHAKGVRAIFPVHKHDNGFSAGDGHRDIIELSNFIQSGHWSNFTQDCPDIPTVFDQGDVAFGGINKPRQDYFAPAPNNMSGFSKNPLKALLPFVSQIGEGPLVGDYCQNAGITDRGEFLVTQLMKRGMIIELDHFPRRGYERAFEILKTNDYPGVGTHGNNNRGELYKLGGVSKFNFEPCSQPDQPATRLLGLENRLDLIRTAGGYPAEGGFGFDLNGFAGAPGPRFGEKSICSTPQQNPVTYPFKSVAGDITFTQPRVANRILDFNTEGLVHIGLLPELIEDVRRDGITDQQLEPVFRSAEAYLRMWEKAEKRSHQLHP